MADGDTTSDGNQQSTGVQRAAGLKEQYDSLSQAGILKVFYGTTTLEAEIFAFKENEKLMRRAYHEQHPQSDDKWDALSAKAAESDKLQRALLFSNALHDQESTFDLGKGDFSQDLAFELENNPTEKFTVPKYIRDGIDILLSPLLNEINTAVEVDTSEETE